MDPRDDGVLFAAPLEVTFGMTGSAMSDDNPLSDRRIEQLTQEVRALSARVDELSLRLAAVPIPIATHAAAGIPEDDTYPDQIGHPEWSVATILAGMAAVCFLLVIALTLRTLVDNRIIDQPIGALAGLIYASLILVYGYYRARTKGRFASLSTTCGAVLVLAIVLETHFRFKILSAEAAYAILAGTLSIMLVAGLLCHAYGPMSIALPGITLVAMSLNFPDPQFVYLAAVLALGAVAAYGVTSDPRTRWLVWCVLALSIFFWMWWTIKLRAPLLRHEPVNASAWQQWFLPVLGGSVLLYTCQTLVSTLSVRRSGGVFEYAVPAIASVGAYFAARSVMLADGRSVSALGQVGSGTALLFLVLSILLSGSGDKGRKAASGFGIAAMLLLAVSLQDTVAAIQLVLMIWAVAAAIIAVLAIVRLEPMVQFAAVLLQVFACCMGVWRGVFSVSAESALESATALVGLCIVCVYHHVAVRRALNAEAGQPIGAAKAAQAFLIVVFWVSVAYAFGAGRIVLYSVLGYFVSEPGYAFECGQSMLINLGALLLALLAVNRNRHDLFVTAAMVAGFGALKVFAYDLLRTQGIPLVVDVFVFGVTTTASSLIWSRWQRKTLANNSVADQDR